MGSHEESRNENLDNSSSPTAFADPNVASNTLLETVIISNRMKNNLSHENSENELFKNKIDENLINLMKISANLDENSQKK